MSNLKYNLQLFCVNVFFLNFSSPRLETLLDVGNDDWLDGISKTNTRGLVMAAACNDAHVLCLHWK